MTPKDKSINVGKSAMPGGARPVFEAAEVTDPESDELEDPSESEEDSERERSWLAAKRPPWPILDSHRQPANIQLVEAADGTISGN